MEIVLSERMKEYYQRRELGEERLFIMFSLEVSDLERITWLLF